MSITVADIPHWRRLFDPTGQPAGYVWTTDGAGGGSYQPAGGGGGNTIIVEDEGTPLATAADTLNFVGAGVTASGTGTTKTITIPGGISGITVEDEGTPLTTDADTLNFTGAGVTASGTGTTKTIDIPGGGGLFTEDAQANIIGGSNTANNFTIFAGNNFLGGQQIFENFATSPDECVMVGNRAGRYATGSRNIAIGYESLRGFSTAAYNGNDSVAIGWRAAVANTGSAAFNVAVGYEAGQRYSSNGNVSIGAESGSQVGGSGNDFNTCVGYQAGLNIGTGCPNNTLIGKGAGRNVRNIGADNNNICLGHEAGPTATGESQKLWIDITQRDDPLIKGDFLNRLLEINGQLDVDGNTANVSFRVDNNVTATETRMLLWDVDNATLARVSVGAANSGGTGFKVLRIPN